MNTVPRKQQGIYGIYNKHTGRVYVGSSVNVQRRWSEHQKHLNAGAHVNQPLQRDWIAFGGAAFTLFVLEEVGSLSELGAAELRWFEYYKDVAYNMQVPSRPSPLPQPQPTASVESSREYVLISPERHDRLVRWVQRNMIMGHGLEALAEGLRAAHIDPLDVKTICDTGRERLRVLYNTSSGDPETLSW